MPPKKRKGTKAKDQKNQKPPEIAEEEQWRIIQETGILKQLEIPQAKPHVETDVDDEEESPFAEELFNAILLIIPFSFLLVMMEILIHHQYGQRVTFKAVFDRIVGGVPIQSIFVFYSQRYKTHRRMRFVMFLLSLAAGPRLIYLINKASWITNMKQAPPVATLWIYTIVQLDLGPATLSLTVVGIWFWWSGFKFSFR